MSELRPCGHRLSDKHFAKIIKLSKQWRTSEAEALRRIIDEA